MSRKPESYILRCVAPDAIGILAAVMGFLAERKLNILEDHDYGDLEVRTLARAVAAHAEERIFLNGQRTVVFA